MIIYEKKILLSTLTLFAFLHSINAMEDFSATPSFVTSKQQKIEDSPAEDASEKKLSFQEIKEKKETQIELSQEKYNKDPAAPDHINYIHPNYQNKTKNSTYVEKIYTPQGNQNKGSTTKMAETQKLLEGKSMGLFF